MADGMPSPRAASPSTGLVDTDDEDDFDRHRRLQLEAAESASEGWKLELDRYLAEPFDKEVTRDTDVVKWWEVRKYTVYMV